MPVDGNVLVRAGNGSCVPLRILPTRKKKDTVDTRPSIFEHVRAHIRQDGPGLLRGGDELPDEKTDGMTTPRGIRFAPGAWEGVQARHMDTEPRDASIVAAEIYTEIETTVAKPTSALEERLAVLLRGSEVRRVIDLVLDRIGADPPRDPDRLYRVMRHLFMTSGHRDVVKLSMAVMATFLNPSDIQLFHTIGRHEEFTLYSVAHTRSRTRVFPSCGLSSCGPPHPRTRAPAGSATVPTR